MLRSPEVPAESPIEKRIMPDDSRLSQRARWAAGQPVSYLMHKALAQPELISLAAGFVDQPTLPVDVMRQATEALLSDPTQGRAALQYGITPGYLPLREALLERLLAADKRSRIDANLSVEQTVVGAGSNQLLHLVSDVLLDPGDIVLCGAPTYFVYMGTLNNLGARAVGVQADENGLIPAALDEELKRRDRAGELGRVKAIYVMSYFDNPRSTTLSRDRREQIVDVAQRWSREGKIYIIEDAAYRKLRYTGDDIPSLRSFDPSGDTVILTDTFSKSFSPGIRLGWGFLPKALLEPVLNYKGNIDFGSPNFTQHLMAKVLELGLFEPHVERLQANYATKKSAMLEAADEYLSPLPGVHWGKPAGGLYVWLTLPEEIDAGPDGKLFDRALEEGMIYVPGGFCYPNEGAPRLANTIRLSFGVQPPNRIHKGIEALARAIRDVT